MLGILYKTLSVFSIIMSLDSGNYVINFEEIKKQATLIVHTDLTDFELVKTLPEILKSYTVEVLDAEGVKGISFFKITPEETDVFKKTCKDCRYILAYDHRKDRFFRLYGFTINEFTEFYNVMINYQRVKFVDYEMNTSKIRKQVLNEVYVKDYDFKYAYKTYFQNLKNSYYDPSSNRRKIIGFLHMY